MINFVLRENGSNDVLKFDLMPENHSLVLDQIKKLPTFLECVNINGDDYGFFEDLNGTITKNSLLWLTEMASQYMLMNEDTKAKMKYLKNSGFDFEESLESLYIVSSLGDDYNMNKPF
jgi:hypothetical protein